MSFETLKLELSELKCAFYNPRIYIANYRDSLRNRIDLSMTEQAINLAKDEISTDKVRQSHNMMADQIRSFENECQNQFLDNKIRDLKSNKNILEEIIDIEIKIENYIDTNHNEEDRNQINDIMVHIESCLFDIHEKIFKKGFLFLTSNILENIKEEANTPKKSKNLLVAVDNFIVPTKVIDK